MPQQAETGEFNAATPETMPAARPGDAHVVHIGPGGPAVTSEAAVSPPEAVRALDSNGQTGRIKPVMRDTDHLVLEPLVNRLGIDSGRLTETEPVVQDVPFAVETSPGIPVISASEEDMFVTDGATPAFRNRIVKVNRKGERTATEVMSAPLASGDSPDTGPPSTSVRVVVRTENDGNDHVNIEATGKTVTDTFTPDGTTRIIRIAPEAGREGSTLITITKN
jgi:hypothetical protein